MNLSKSLLLACTVALLPDAALASSLPPIKPVAYVDLPHFMGPWYLIASIPTVFEKHAWNAVETYTLQPNGHVHSTFRFNNGAADGPVKHIQSTGYVHSGTGNAVWGVKVFGPFKAQYIVAWLKPDYSEMIVARDARDYTWVFARTPTVSPAEYDALMAKAKALGYPMDKIRKVPQAGAQAKR